MTIRRMPKMMMMFTVLVFFMFRNSASQYTTTFTIAGRPESITNTKLYIARQICMSCVVLCCVHLHYWIAKVIATTSPPVDSLHLNFSSVLVLLLLVGVIYLQNSTLETWTTTASLVGWGKYISRKERERERQADNYTRTIQTST